MPSRPSAASLSACAAIALAALAASAAADADADADVDPELLVKTPLGAFQGVYAHQEQAVSFLGIPYSVQPVGERRWTDPEYPAPHDGVYNASSFGAQCVQDCGTWRPRAPPP